jgi:hypothetical protein
MTMKLKRMLTLIAGLVTASASFAALANESQFAVVMTVHSERSTRAFIANNRLPPGQVEGGRFAVVKLVNGAWGDASFALVYVPERLLIAEHDVVELQPSDISVLTKPGSGVVTQVARTTAMAQ